MLNKVKMFQNLFINLIIIIKALAVGLWFFATGRMFNKLFPAQTWNSIAISMVICVVILGLDDGKLSELHQLKDTTVAAAMNMFSTDKHQQQK